MPRARLAAASSLLAAGLLAFAPEAAVAFADSSSGSDSSGGSTSGTSGTSSTTGTTGTTTGTSTGGTTTGSGTSTTGGTATGGTTTTGSSTTGGSTTGGSLPSLQSTLGGMVGQFTRIIQHPASIIGGTPLTGLLPGVKPNSGQSIPQLIPGATSPSSGSAPAPTKSAAPQPSAAVTPDATTDTADTTAAATPKPPLAQIPLAVAQVPLTALDLVKTTIPVVVDAVPIPGLAALPAFANALIDPIENTVRGLAAAASDMPLLQWTPGMPITLAPLDNRAVPNSTPLGPKTFAAAAGPLPLDVSPGAPGTTVKPVPPIQPRETFAAENHVVASKDFRPGYPDYLRAAGISEVAAVAVPGFAGIITLTAAGGLVGYRQARATSSAPARAARFVN